MREKRSAHPLLVQFHIGAELAREVAGFRQFDLDHVRAQLSELIAAERTGEHVGQVEHANAFEERHGYFLA